MAEVDLDCVVAELDRVTVAAAWARATDAVTIERVR
jgi:hypothetical protein